MVTKYAGFQWLKDHYFLTEYEVSHISYIGNNESIELSIKGNVVQVYGPRYKVNDEPIDHIEFALKYDDWSLDLLKAIFEKMAIEEISLYIHHTPSAKMTRKIGFLYEFLTGNEINLAHTFKGNYIDLLDDKKYFTGSTIKNVKWKINNNLIGNEEYCPIVRKTKSLLMLLAIDVKEKIKTLKENYAPEIFNRAVNFLYNKETRSSYEIEKEMPSAHRTEKFVSLLLRAGTTETDKMISRERLIQLQNAIVDARFASEDYRDYQNFVGEILSNYQDLIHYICPPPSMVNGLMGGLKASWLNTKAMPAPIRAAIISFGFVFIHPFEDGNGRLHRFLIHDILAHDAIVPSGVIIPISAHILHHIKEYDSILEKYSKPLLKRIKYDKNVKGDITISNLEAIDGYYRYPDLTPQCEYLLQTIHATINEDMPNELLFLQRYNEVKNEIQQIVDMPDRDINQMLILLHQNKGILAKRKRDQFSKLTDTEIGRMEIAFKSVFEIDQSK
ncbi:MAG: Fic family protein [Saprospiraceae bacterium]